MRPLTLPALIVLTAVSGPAVAAPGNTNARFPYPYQGATFDSFVKRSYQVAGRKNPGEFYQWMETSLRQKQGRTWEALLASYRSKLASKDPAKRAEAEMALSAELHKSLKKTITKFSLDRGFEFTNVVATCERQCFLQSVTIAGLLQKAGVNAGVVMVWKNPQGQTSNNGHACVLVNLADGRQVTVDASDPTPFIEHQGLFVHLKSMKGYHFVEPVFNADHTIGSYRVTGTAMSAPTASVRELDVPFLRSQFDYYRGERVPNGILDKKATPQTLAASEAFFRSSLKENAGNPLTLAMLALTLNKEGKTAEASKVYQNAYSLYTRYGWVPDAVLRGAGR